MKFLDVHQETTQTASKHLNLCQFLIKFRKAQDGKPMNLMMVRQMYVSLLDAFKDFAHKHHVTPSCIMLKW